MKRRKARDMLERRIKRGREEEFFTVQIVRLGSLKLEFVIGRFLTFLCECFWVMVDIFEFIGHVEDFV
jgi:hypothetical protein